MSWGPGELLGLKVGSGVLLAEAFWEGGGWGSSLDKVLLLCPSVCVFF